MIERNRSDCKYIYIFKPYTVSIGMPSIRTVLIKGGNIKVQNLANIASRNTKCNISQEGTARFMSMIDLNKKGIASR
jgi:hypothetical protein